MEPRKQAILGTLRRFIAQRPGLEFGNYGDVSAYRSEMRAITKDRHHADTLLTAVAWRDGITADMLLEASRSAYGGRLSISTHSECITKGGGHGSDPDLSEWREVATVDYCAGQYFPTEYRKAVCAVLASALWAHVRESCMPAPEYVQHGSADDLPMCTESVYGPRKLSAGDWLRAYFRKEFGRSIAERYFS